MQCCDTDQYQEFIQPLAEAMMVLESSGRNSSKNNFKRMDFLPLQNMQLCIVEVFQKGKAI